MPRVRIGFRARFALSAAGRSASECWPWYGSLDNHGYGTTVVLGRNVKAHRAAYVEFRGLIPPGALVCHSCDNPACINPAHLFLGDALVNQQDKNSKGRGKYPGPRRRKLTAWDVRRIRAHAGPVNPLVQELGISRNHYFVIRRRGVWKGI